MEYIYAAMLLHKAGKGITESAVKSVLTAAGVSTDEVRVKALVAALDGVNIDAAIEKAALVAPAAAAPTPSAGSAPAGAGEAKKEEKSKEDDKKAEESAAAGLGALFG